MSSFASVILRREFPLDLDGAGAQEEGVTSRTSPWCYDLPEIPELDNLFSPEVRRHSTAMMLRCREAESPKLGSGCHVVGSRGLVAT